MSASKPSQPLNITTAALHRAALSGLSLPPDPQPTFPLAPPPASIPHSKLIPKTRFIVDGFKHADTNFSVSYFLSHFHSDHYTGLSPQWSKGIIYCSSITANLLHQILKIPRPFILPLPLSQPLIIDGAEVWLVDANHCPGAVQFLFKVPASCDGGAGSSGVVTYEKYVHTGDFRYCDEMKNESALSEFIGADAVFLDTTYCNPKFVFPSQEESIDYIVGVIERIGVENEGVAAKNVLFLVATYVIGKERILVEISRRCKRKIHVSGRKMAVLSALGFGENGVFTEDELESDVHVVGWNVLGETWPYFRPNFVKMKEIMSERGYSKVVGFVPTGWTYEVKRNKFAVRSKDSFEIHLVPYSEHSNYDELREFVKFLKPKRVIPTVGADVEKVDSKHAFSMRKHFAGLVNEMAIKQEFLMGFLRGGSGLVDVEKDCPIVLQNIPDQEDEVIASTPNCCSDVELEDDIKSSFPQQVSASSNLEDMKENNVEKSVKELRDCLPSWVTLCQMLDLLNASGGNVVEAVSNFYEHETEFHEQVLPSTSASFTSLGSSENQPPLPFESQNVKGITRSEDISFSQNFKLSSSVNIKKSGVSPGKRKRNLDSKTKKRARADSTGNSSDLKQYRITKFFNKKMLVVSEDCKVEVESCNFNDDQSRLPVDDTKLYEEEVNQFIQIVSGGESLRSYATTILEKTKGDINMALDIYYNDKNGTTIDVNDSKRYMESKCPSRVSSGDGDALLSENNKLETKSDIFSPALPKGNLSANYISLPPERYSPTEHACWRKGQPAPYIHIARTFDLVEEEKGKLKATSMLCNMFRSLLVLSPEDVLPTVYLCTNKIAPEHENLELNIGGSIVVAALEEACGTSRAKISNLYNSLGDLDLKDLFGEEKPGYFEYAREITVESEDADVKNEATLNRMNSFLNDAIHSSCEGIMVKSLDVDAGYTPSKRSDAWLKVKRDYVEGLSDSLDLVPIGAWHGNGRKAGWFSPFLMACYNPDTEDFQSVCRVMSGFSDVFYTEMKEFFSGDRVLSKRPPYYKTSEMPDMWFSPELVWEIRGADFTVSPVHHAAIGLVHPSRGISVRFPRFIRSLSDRKPEECSTAADIADMFSLQTRKMDVNTKR
ncbi:UNVERIFIED_CONTAM: DNA ligase 6 [Sesamum calycinum]|uniref:DNA ligase 6 n=1 Tax=Sesamum calycinum TaxID=2727403 RepID=A0AAW2MPP1_9LAMI